MAYSHHSVSIIDPHYGNIDFNKRELLHLLGREDNMLGACPESLEWIKSLPDDVQGQWIWDNLPDPSWYPWLLSELWDVERNCIAEADPDWFDLAGEIEERFVSGSLSSARAETDIGRFIERCNQANHKRHKRLMAPHYVNIFQKHYGGDGGARTKYMEDTVKYRTLHQRVSAKLHKRFLISPEIRAIEAKFAQQVRDSDLLPDWERVRTVFRHYYEQESTHATEFWKEYNNE